MTNSKTTKRALVSSALAVFMCVAMLIGTTFAWFTDTASTSVNKIQAGTLDVALEVADGKNADGTTKWVSAEGKTLDFVKAEGHENEAILWEPGCTYSLPELRIVNKGNLALKYKVLISGIKGDAKLNEVIDWTIGTVAEGEEQHLAAGASTAAFTIKGTMQASAGNAYQGLSIDGIAITVTATQDTVEHDSTTDQYDKDATYSSADPNLTKMLISDGSLTINETLSINSNETRGNSDVIRVTGGNHVITGGVYTASGNNSNSALRVDGGNVTIKGGVFTVEGASNAIYGAGGNITIEAGTFKSTEAYNGTFFTLNCQDNSASLITVKGGRFYKFDPSHCNVAPAGKTEVVVAEGYKVVESGDWYCVIPKDGSLVSDVNGLDDAIAAGKEAVLSEDIVTGNNASYGGYTVGIKLVAGATLNGNGNTLSKGDDNGFAILTHGATIKNLTLNDGGRAIFIDKPTADTLIDNVIINGAGYAINTGSKGNANAKLIVTNSTVNGWTSFANLASASFTNCSFGKSNYYAQEVYQHYLRPFVTVTFTECDFDNGFYIDATKLAAGCTITLDNCTCNGVKLTNANFADYVKLIKGVANNADVYANNGDSLTNVIFR